MSNSSVMLRLTLGESSTKSFKRWGDQPDAVMDEYLERTVRSYTGIFGDFILVYVPEEIPLADVKDLISTLSDYGINFFQMKATTEDIAEWGMQTSPGIKVDQLSFGIFELIHRTLHKHYISKWRNNNELK